MKTPSTTINELISATRGRFFTIEFIKRNGELRKMTARIGVTKHIRGGGLAFSPQERNLRVVVDVIAKGYRMINLATVQSFRFAGTAVQF